MGHHDFKVSLKHGNYGGDWFYVIGFYTKDAAEGFCSWLTDTAGQYGSEWEQAEAKKLADALRLRLTNEYASRGGPAWSSILWPENMSALFSLCTALLESAQTVQDGDRLDVSAAAYAAAGGEPP